MNKYLLLLVVVIALFSCKKKTDTPAPVESAYDYYPMKPGNYWVYEWFNTDTTGVITGISGPADSVCVRTDTVIRGNTYYVLDDYNGTSLGGIFRDSSGYMVNQDGRIFFSTQNFSHVLHVDSGYAASTLYQVYSWMMNNNVVTVAPAGTFNTIQYKGTLLYNASFGTNPKYYEATDYAKNTGLVLTHEYYEYSPDNVVEIRLLRYHVQ